MFTVGDLICHQDHPGDWGIILTLNEVKNLVSVWWKIENTIYKKHTIRFLAEEYQILKVNK